MDGAMQILVIHSYTNTHTKTNQHHRIPLLSGKTAFHSFKGLSVKTSKEKMQKLRSLQLAPIITSAKQAQKNIYERTKTQGGKIGSAVLVLANRVSQLHIDTTGKRTQSGDVTAATQHA